MRSAMIVVVLGLAIPGAGGCRAGGQIVARESSPLCPGCETETVTLPIQGLTYDRHLCPDCRQETAFDPRDQNELAEVHACRTCRAVVERCPQCRAR